MKPLRTLACLSAALAVPLLVGCPGGSGKPKVAFVSNNPHEFWKIAQAGAEKAAKEADVDLVFRMPAQGDVTAQKEVIDTVMQQGIRAIAVSVIDPRNQQAYLDEIAEKVPLLTQDNDAPKSKRLCYIGTDNYAAGRAVGKLIKEVMPGGGTVAVFVGDLVPLNARQRYQGVIDELAGEKTPDDLNNLKPPPRGGKFGKYTVPPVYTDQPLGETKAKENAQNALEKFGGRKDFCMVGLWAYNPPMILSAVKDKKMTGKVHIVGFDEDNVTLDGIQDGDVYATVVQDPYNFGYESVKMMAALARGDRSVVPEGGVKHVPYRVITKDGGEKNGLKRIPVKKFHDELKRLLGK